MSSKFDEWVFAAPYIRNDYSQISEYWKLVQQKANVNLQYVAAKYDHDRSRSSSSLTHWIDYWGHARSVWKKVNNNSGIITAFPQLPAMIGLRKRFLNKSTPIVASTFNLGRLYPGKKRKLARYSLKSVNKFIVHSTYEVKAYAEYLDLPEDRFEFIHLHRPVIYRNEKINTKNPFILSMGAAKRDYNCLVEAVKGQKIELVIVAPKRLFQNMHLPNNVKILSNLTLEECRSLVQQASLSIIPIDNDNTASGQVTVIEAMMYGCPVVATDSIGTRDYIDHRNTGILVKSKSIEEMKHAILECMEDHKFRQKMAEQGHVFFKEHLTYVNASSKMARILRSFE